jgi:hypothetical protein
MSPLSSQHTPLSVHWDVKCCSMFKFVVMYGNSLFTLAAKIFLCIVKLKASIKPNTVFFVLNTNSKYPWEVLRNNYTDSHWRIILWYIGCFIFILPPPLYAGKKDGREVGGQEGEKIWARAACSAFMQTSYLYIMRQKFGCWRKSTHLTTICSQKKGQCRSTFIT